ncbi:MAG: TIGR03757 family integrating conjugative element protein [Gammaproteobacteria bacterium]
MNINTLVRLLFAACLVLSMTITHAQTLHVDVFTTHALPVTRSQSVTANVYFLDEPARLIAQLEKDLPNTLEEAKAIALDRINRQNQRWVKQMNKHYKGVISAWSSHVAYLPAIVINDQYVIYGVYDIDQALSIYQDSIDEARP